MTFALLPDLTFASITEKQTNRKQNNENTQKRQRKSIRTGRLNYLRDPCGMEKEARCHQEGRDPVYRIGIWGSFPKVCRWHHASISENRYGNKKLKEQGD
jgi:hypothetical protein